MKRSIEDGLSLLAGAGIGVLAMYLLDPRSGAQRRQRLAAVTREAVDAAGETIAPVIGSVASGAAKVAESVGHAGSQLWESGQHYMSEAGESVSHGAADVSRRTRSLFNGKRRGHWRKRGKRGIRQILYREPETHGLGVAPAAAGGIGLLALGAGIAWLFDPDQGEARRHWLRDKAFSLLRDISDMSRKTGQHIANQMYGTYAEFRSAWQEGDVANQQLEARVRSDLGRAVSDMSSISVIAEQGHVTLIGSLASDEIADAVSTARAVRGVKGVEDQLRPRSEPTPGGQGSPAEGGQSPGASLG